MQFLYLLISLAVVLADQGLKFFIVKNFHLGEVRPVVPGFLSFNYIQNNGAAWNILPGQMLFFYLISLIAIFVCIYYLFQPKYKNVCFDIGLSLVLGGILGNFLDRLHLKYVIDMLQLDFINFNIFNLADSAITIGVVLIFIYLVFGEEEKQNDR